MNLTKEELKLIMEAIRRLSPTYIVNFYSWEELGVLADKLKQEYNK
jgi:hypothetical protein